MIFTLALALSLASPSAQASAQNDSLVSTATQLVKGAQADVSFLDRNVAGCTVFADTIREWMITPMAKELQSFQLRLARYHDTAPQSCTSRADLDFMHAVIAKRIAMATQQQDQLMGMTGDDAMTKALSGDDPANNTHPQCTPENPRDVRTTRQLKTYFALKLKMVSLKGLVASLRENTDCVKQEN